jgi:hypothetical protein
MGLTYVRSGFFASARPVETTLQGAVEGDLVGW